MEHIDGPTLEQCLAKSGPLSEAQVHTVFAEAVAGLARRTRRASFTATSSRGT